MSTRRVCLLYPNYRLIVCFNGLCIASNSILLMYNVARPSGSIHQPIIVICMSSTKALLNIRICSINFHFVGVCIAQNNNNFAQ
jgi:hypothetical protein